VVEFLPSKQAVAGSSPVSRSTELGCHENFQFSWPKEWARSSVAERPAHNRLVAGSNPAEPIIQLAR
jgi:hypothetical protein